MPDPTQTTERSLSDFMRESETDPFLLTGPPAPKIGWIYRDFRLMPIGHFACLVEVLGNAEIDIIAATQRGDRCRAQMWISPAAQAAWRSYVDGGPQ